MKKWSLLKTRIETGIETVKHQDRKDMGLTHEHYQGMVAGFQTVLDWMRMSEQGEENEQRNV